MSIKIVTSVNEFAQLRDEWNHLVLSNKNLTPYQTWEWCFTWWKYLKGDKELFIIVARNNNNHIQIILPLWKRYYSKNIISLEIIGTRGTDYLDWIVGLQINQDILKELTSFLLSEVSWDILNLEDVPGNSSLVKYTHEIVKDNNLVSSSWISSPCYSIHLHQSWISYLSSLSKPSRHDILYNRRYLEKTGNIEYVQRTADYFETHVQIHQKRHNKLGRPGSYAFNRAAAFRAEIANLFEQQGWLRLSFLYINNCPVSSIFASEFHRKVFVMTVGFDPEYAKYSVGNVLYGMDIQKSIEGCSVNEYDLSRGDESYKKRFGAEYKTNLGIAISRGNDTIERYWAIRSEFLMDLGYSPSDK